MGKNGKKRKRILIGVVLTLIEEDFLKSFTQMLADNTEYELTPRFIWNHPPVIGNNMLAAEAVEGNYDYLMLIGRRYAGFTIQMLHDMVETDADIACCRYRYDEFPFTHLPIDFDGDDDHKLLAVSETTGTREVKLAGLDFCVIKTSILRRLNAPYFRDDNANNLIQKSQFDFNNRVRALGGKIVACLDHYLPHEFMTDNVKRNIHELYRFMNDKKLNPEGVKQKGERVRKEYNDMIATPITDTILHVLTPSARPENLAEVNRSIYRALKPHNVSVNWHIMYKNHDNKFNIIPQYNRYLDGITTGWFTLMCDDNMFHPGLFRAFSETLSTNPNMGVYVVGIMGHRGTTQMAGPEFCKPFNCDAAQYFFKRELLGDLRFNTGDLAHGADGQLLRELFAAHPESFVFDDRIIAYHEALKTEGFKELECYNTKDVKAIKENQHVD